MNERIKKLIEQVGTDVSGKWIRIDNAEKLTELVVQDCIDILAGYRGKVTWLNEEEMHQHPIFVIQNHFGIKR